MGRDGPVDVRPSGEQALSPTSKVTGPSPSARSPCAPASPSAAHRSRVVEGWASASSRNDTHESATNPEARLARKGNGKEAKLSYGGNLLTENRGRGIDDGDRDGRTRRRRRDGAPARGRTTHYGGRGQRLRHAGFRQRSAGGGSDAARLRVFEERCVAPPPLVAARRASRSSCAVFRASCPSGRTGPSSRDGRRARPD